MAAGGSDDIVGEKMAVVAFGLVVEVLAGA